MSQTNAAGNKHTGSASVKIDPSGNVSGTLDYQYQTKGGTSLTRRSAAGWRSRRATRSRSAGGGFDVTYTLSDSKGVAVGAGKQVGGGPSVGFQAGSTDASLETGTMHFADEEQAKAFRDDAAAVIVRERILHQPPTTVAGRAGHPHRRGTWPGRRVRVQHRRIGLAGGSQRRLRPVVQHHPQVLRAACQRDRGRGHGPGQRHQGLGLVDQRRAVRHQGLLGDQGIRGHLGVRPGHRSGQVLPSSSMRSPVCRRSSAPR